MQAIGEVSDPIQLPKNSESTAIAGQGHTMSAGDKRRNLESSQTTRLASLLF